MEKITLIRTYKGNDCTTGELKDALGNHLAFTLEEPWLDNKQGISCIPVGEYYCKAWNGNKFRDVWNVAEVPNRSAVLIHSGNTVVDIEGCILVGEITGSITLKTDKVEKGVTFPQGTKLKAVLNSKAALAVLKDFIGRDPNNNLKTFILKIKYA